MGRARQAQEAAGQAGGPAGGPGGDAQQGGVCAAAVHAGQLPAAAAPRRPGRPHHGRLALHGPPDEPGAVAVHVGGVQARLHGRRHDGPRGHRAAHQAVQGGASGRRDDAVRVRHARLQELCGMRAVRGVGRAAPGGLLRHRPLQRRLGVCGADVPPGPRPAGEAAGRGGPPAEGVQRGEPVHAQVGQAPPEERVQLQAAAGAGLPAPHAVVHAVGLREQGGGGAAAAHLQHRGLVRGRDGVRLLLGGVGRRVVVTPHLPAGGDGGALVQRAGRAPCFKKGIAVGVGW
mmetsp:Transcript_16745/g.42390  ORF Transcript_16745/g.42390 Transcript_16745/m.42390 type:complete len:288 (-) Transcript_16745:473-1336(-)